MSKSENKCIVCEIDLNGRQSKYCSNECAAILDNARMRGYNKRINITRKKRKMLAEERQTLVEEVRAELMRPTPQLKTEMVLVDELGKPIH